MAPSLAQERAIEAEVERAMAEDDEEAMEEESEEEEDEEVFVRPGGSDEVQQPLADACLDQLSGFAEKGAHVAYAAHALMEILERRRQAQAAVVQQEQKIAELTALQTSLRRQLAMMEAGDDAESEEVDDEDEEEYEHAEAPPSADEEAEMQSSMLEPPGHEGIFRALRHDVFTWGIAPQDPCKNVLETRLHILIAPGLT
eukprot:scaffold73310_cov31-Tisochrysis_lutea.AAC.3